jgi:hypothetical protein
VAIFPRVFQDDTPEDKRAIQPLLSQIVVYPLSEFDGKMKTKDWTKTPSFPAPAAGSGETKWVIPEKFFDELPQVMKEIPPLPGEESLYRMFQSVLDAAAKDASIKNALTQTAIAAEDELIKPLFEFHNNGRPIGAPRDKRTTSVVCVSDSDVYEMSESKVRQLYYQNPSFGFAVIRLIIGRLLEDINLLRR